MKKNFLKVAALLIAAMLMVVSCSQEVAPKTEDNGLVEATIGLGRSGRDVTVTPGNGTTINYYYTLKPKWSDLSNGAPIYGAKETETILAENKAIDAGVSSTSLGLVTPGLWEIEVKGYVENSTKTYSQLVLQGKTNAYFVKDSTSATVFVAPVTNADKKGKLKIDVSMQDLGAGNNTISYCVYNLDGSEDVKGTITAGESNISNNVGSYVKDDIQVSAGYKTITLSVPSDMGRGGITKNFLMIPTAADNDIEVTISGSIYPSDFQNSAVEVKVIKVNTGTITVKEGNTGVNPTTVDGVEGVYTLDGSKEYTFKYENGTSSVPQDASSPEVTYKWYLGSAHKASASETNSTGLEIKTANGDFSITCVATYTYTLDGTLYKVEASQTLGKVRVLTSSTTD